MNNPLLYADPSGEFIFSALATVFCPQLIPLGIMMDNACWGAVIGGACYTASVALSNGGFNNWNGGDFWKSVGIGALSGFATGYIGNQFGAIGGGAETFGGKVAYELGRAFCHGVSQAMVSGFTGGKPMQSSASAGLSSLTGSGFIGLFGQNVVGTYVFSGLAGGLTQELMGGDFWQGAALGIMNAGLNHLRSGFYDDEGVKAESLGLGENPSLEELVNALYSNMSEGNYITGKELTKLSPRINKNMSFGIKSLNRVNGGFKVDLTKTGNAAIKLSDIEFNDGNILKVTKLAYKGQYIFHIVGDGCKIYYGKNLVNLDFYIDNDYYSIYNNFKTIVRW